MQTHGAPGDGWLQRFLFGRHGVPLAPGLSHSLPCGQIISSVTGLHLQFAVSLLSTGHSASASGGHSQAVQSVFTLRGSGQVRGHPHWQLLKQKGFLESLLMQIWLLGPGGSHCSPASTLLLLHCGGGGTSGHWHVLGSRCLPSEHLGSSGLHLT